MGQEQRFQPPPASQVDNRGGARTGGARTDEGFGSVQLSTPRSPAAALGGGARTGAVAGEARSRGAGYLGVRAGGAVGRHQCRRAGGAASARRASWFFPQACVDVHAESIRSF